VLGAIEAGVKGAADGCLEGEMLGWKDGEVVGFWISNGKGWPAPVENREETFLLSLPEIGDGSGFDWRSGLELGPLGLFFWTEVGW